MIKVQTLDQEVETLRPVVESWQKAVIDNEFNILADNVDKYLAELHIIAYSNESDLLVLYDDDTPIGYIGLRYFESPLGANKVANEHYFYIVPEKRGIASMRLLKMAKTLAKLKGCSHIIFNASNLASDFHDKVCSFYEKLGMKKFETSYISELE